MNTLPPSYLVRGARGLLDWSKLDLAKAAGVSISTIQQFESERLSPVPSDVAEAIRTSLETAGILFLPDDGNGPGLRLRAGSREAP